MERLKCPMGDEHIIEIFSKSCLIEKSVKKKNNNKEHVKNTKFQFKFNP